MPRKSVVAGKAGAVRIRRLTLAELGLAEKHGKRQDAQSKARRVRDADPVTTTGLDLESLYLGHIQGAKVQAVQTVALHAIIQWPTHLVDKDDAIWMLEKGREFLESVFGREAVFADRCDRDEIGVHNTDFFVAPRYVKKTKHTQQIAISTTKHLKELAHRNGTLAAYNESRARAKEPQPPVDTPNLHLCGVALQTEFHRFLVEKCGLADAKRGSTKRGWDDDWVPAEELDIERRQEEAAEFKRDAVLELLDAQKAREEAEQAKWHEVGLLESTLAMNEDAEKALARAQAREHEATAERLAAHAKNKEAEAALARAKAYEQSAKADREAAQIDRTAADAERKEALEQQRRAEKLRVDAARALETADRRKAALDGQFARLREQRRRLADQIRKRRRQVTTARQTAAAAVDAAVTEIRVRYATALAEAVRAGNDARRVLSGAQAWLKDAQNWVTAFGGVLAEVPDHVRTKVLAIREGTSTAAQAAAVAAPPKLKTAHTLTELPADEAERLENALQHRLTPGQIAQLQAAQKKLGR